MLLRKSIIDFIHCVLTLYHSEMCTYTYILLELYEYHTHVT